MVLQHSVEIRPKIRHILVPETLTSAELHSITMSSVVQIPGRKPHFPVGEPLTAAGTGRLFPWCLQWLLSFVGPAPAPIPLLGSSMSRLTLDGNCYLSFLYWWIYVQTGFDWVQQADEGGANVQLKQCFQCRWGPAWPHETSWPGRYDGLVCHLMFLMQSEDWNYVLV